METKFCTACQCHRSVEGGVTRRGRHFMRWICKPCIERKTESIYKNRSGNVANVAKIMRDLYARQR